MFLCRVVGSDTGEVVYIIESGGTKSAFWKRDESFRSNGMITIGTYFVVIGAKPIEKVFYNDIPILETDFPAIIMRKPFDVAAVDIDNDIDVNTTRAFVLKKMTLKCNYVSAMNTNCGGNFCDKQRAVELENLDVPCGCYE